MARVTRLSDPQRDATSGAAGFRCRTNETITVPYIIGIDFDETVSGVTIKNLNVNWFSIGIYIRTTNNTFMGNSASDNIVGVLLSGSGNSIFMNYIRNNRQGYSLGLSRLTVAQETYPRTSASAITVY